jgi:RNA polymerase sigma-70 factor, ECF subfamily
VNSAAPTPQSVAVLDAARSGDRAAVGALLASELPRIRRTVARYVGGTDVDDVAQEVLIEVYRGLANFRGDSALSTWIHTICVRRAYAHRRKRRWLLPLTALRFMADRSDRRADAHMELSGLWKELERLPPDRRTVFVLHDLEGHTGPEIANLLDIPVTTVHTRLRAARLEIRRRIGRDT